MDLELADLSNAGGEKGTHGEVPLRGGGFTSPALQARTGRMRPAYDQQAVAQPLRRLTVRRVS